MLSGGDSSGFYLRVGEGATPTWESGAHYTSFPDNKTNATDVCDECVGSPQTLKYYIDNVNSSSQYKYFNGWDSYVGTGGYVVANNYGYWNADTNLITGLELVPVTGNISGTCSLYGMN